MAEALWRRTAWDLRAFGLLAGMWVRVSWTYRTSFWLMLVGSVVISGVDFAAILVLFSRVDRLGGFTIADIGFLYGASMLALGVGDLVLGNVERLGRRIRLGSFDAMLVRPVGVFVQLCADEFAVRRLGRVLQGLAVLGWALGAVEVDWDVARVVVTAVMLVCGAAIFSALFVLGATFQFVSTDGSELANAFTYGGGTLSQYPMTIYPLDAVKALTFAVPIAFVNWYPALFVLGRRDPFGLPSWLQGASPVAAAVLCVLAALAWRTGVRSYRSTGS